MRTLILALFFSTAAYAGDPAPMDPVQEERVLAYVQKDHPQLAEELLGMRELAKIDPTFGPVYQEVLRHEAEEMREAQRSPELAARHVVMKALRDRITEIATAYPSAPEDEQAAQRAEMEDLAGKLLDLRQLTRRERLAALEVRLEELRAEIEERDLNRDRVVSRYVDTQILSVTETPRWKQRLGQE